MSDKHLASPNPEHTPSSSSLSLSQSTSAPSSRRNSNDHGSKMGASGLSVSTGPSGPLSGPAGSTGSSSALALGSASATISASVATNRLSPNSQTKIHSAARSLATLFHSGEALLKDSDFSSKSNVANQANDGTLGSKPLQATPATPCKKTNAGPSEKRGRRASELQADTISSEPYAMTRLSFSQRGYPIQTLNPTNQFSQNPTNPDYSTNPDYTTSSTHANHATQKPICHSKSYPIGFSSPRKKSRKLNHPAAPGPAPNYAATYANYPNYSDHSIHSNVAEFPSQSSHHTPEKTPDNVTSTPENITSKSSKSSLKTPELETPAADVANLTEAAVDSYMAGSADSADNAEDAEYSKDKANAGAAEIATDHAIANDPNSNADSETVENAEGASQTTPQQVAKILASELPFRRNILPYQNQQHQQHAIHPIAMSGYPPPHAYPPHYQQHQKHPQAHSQPHGNMHPDVLGQPLPHPHHQAHTVHLQPQPQPPFSRNDGSYRMQKLMEATRFTSPLSHEGPRTSAHHSHLVPISSTSLFASDPLTAPAPMGGIGAVRAPPIAVGGHMEPSEDAKTSATRKEKSLGILCQNFMDLYRGAPTCNLVNDQDYRDRDGADANVEQAEGAVVDICAAAALLGAKRRRIYDIINILESIRIVSRLKKNTYRWHGVERLPRFFAELQRDGLREQAEKAAKAEKEEKERKAEKVGKTSKAKATKTRKGSKAAKPTGKSETDGADKEDSFIMEEDSGGTTKSNKGMANTCQKLIQLFLVTGKVEIGLTDAAEKVLGPLTDPSDADSSKQSKDSSTKEKEDTKSSEDTKENKPSKSSSASGRVMKTKIRRMYDIANVLQSLGIIQKENVGCTNIKNKPSFRWVYKLLPMEMHKYLLDDNVPKVTQDDPEDSEGSAQEEMKEGNKEGASDSKCAPHDNTHVTPTRCLRPSETLEGSNKSAPVSPEEEASSNVIKAPELSHQI